MVVIFLGADPDSITRNGVHGAPISPRPPTWRWRWRKARSRAQARSRCRTRCAARSAAWPARWRPSQRYVRGIFSGGTFCFEAQLVHAAAGIPAFSNTPTAGNRPLETTPEEPGEHHRRHGRRRVHPGPPAPDDRSVAARRAHPRRSRRPDTAVVLFDVVLGYGAADDPTAGLLGVIGSAKAKATAAGRTVAFIGYVCGTDLDPQDRSKVVAGSSPPACSSRRRTRKPPRGPRPSSPNARERSREDAVPAGPQGGQRRPAGLRRQHRRRRRPGHPV